MRDLIWKYTNRNSRFLVVDKTLIHYRDEGEGYPILLLHGAFSSLHTFNEWTNVLKQSYRVIRFDLIGFGLTGPTDEEDYSLEAHIRVLKAFLDILNIEECHIAGSSLGGWLAWEFALKFPKRVNKLMLVDAAGFIDQRSVPLPFKIARTPFLGRAMRYAVNRTVLETFLRQVYFDKSMVTPMLIERYYDLFTREGNPEAFVKMVNCRFKDNTRKLKNITQHTLVMWGREDRWIPLEYADMFYALIPKAELIIYDDCGHIPMEEIPEQSVEDLLKFLRK